MTYGKKWYAANSVAPRWVTQVMQLHVALGFNFFYGREGGFTINQFIILFFLKDFWKLYDMLTI